VAPRPNSKQNVNHARSQHNLGLEPAATAAAATAAPSGRRSDGQTAGLTSSPGIDHTLMVSLAEDSPFLSDKAPACTPVRDEGLGPLTALARAALENDPDKVRRFLDGIAPPCADLPRVMDSAIPTSRTLSRNPHRHRSGAAQYRFEADVSHYAAKIALRVAIAERKKDRARVEIAAPLPSKP